MKAETIIHNLLERLAPSYIEFLKKLIQTPSVFGSEQECQKLVRDRLVDLGLFEREVFASNHPPYLPTGRYYGDRPSVVGRLRGADTAGVFVLSAHIDTAPVEDPSSWTYPPFEAQLVDGKLFGRGVLDDKAGIAMMLMIAEAFLRSGLRLSADVVFESVIEDEDSGNGTLACTEAGYCADAAIAIDGTWPFRIVDAHLGQVWLEIEFYGMPVAACSCRRGVNPIALATKLLAELEAWVDARNRTFGSWLNIESPFFVNAGAIHAGIWPGAVPEKCRVQLQIGFPPPLMPQEIIACVREMAMQCAHADSRVQTNVSLLTLAAAAHNQHSNPLVGLLAKTIARLRSEHMSVINHAIAGHCPLRHFRRRDGTLANACLYGPGGGGNPHARDEYYLCDDFTPVAQNLASLMLSWMADPC